ncbi:branched-chain amino acid ABC transporter permease [Mesorhizobium sp. CGMCC 1.15528]|uniref:Branched-chain amino acid ABC transporter permease n=1 Tax=Mesorhizobium zhangyense TaxID=1776730 RepID=A0A7C9VCN4_9HYPH|nr:branched-chain amino acid ABC transporter permease [Mesorhizobium zhangyense]NGN41690.1 branched-chain amino acid ABC transporter permease [Mesorhizobium zhangyense]
MNFFIEYSIVGIASGGIYALIALGIIVIFKSSKTFNFAMGEMMMLSAYFFYAATVTYSLGLVAGFCVALAGSIAIALLIERVAIRPMLGRPFIAVVMVTFGIGSIIRGVVGMVWGPNDLQIPAILSRSPVMLGDIFIPGKTARAFAIAVVIVVGLIAYLRYSRAGVALRAAAADAITAYSMGIDVRRIIAFTWIIAAITGCISGVLMANVNTLTPHLGMVALNVLAVVILGGMNSIGGVLIAGFIIGWLEAVTGLMLGTEYREITPYILALMVLLVRPTGLFGTKEIERI